MDLSGRGARVGERWWTLREFGVELPTNYNASLQDLDLVAVRRGRYRPGRMQREAELMALLITMAPPEFWRQEIRT